MQYPYTYPGWGFRMYPTVGYSRNLVLLDRKQGDVNGDGIVDTVYLYGNKPEGPSGLFADSITLVIEDGRSKHRTAVHLDSNAGYNASLFLGDFDKDGINDILVSIESGGSGGYGIYYMYAFKNNVVRKMFDFDAYNQAHQFRVDYEDFYKVSVSSPELDVLFIIDISTKGPEYLSQYYNDDGKLKKPVKGEALAIGALYPIVTDPRKSSYDLLALQRIIGTINADTLGYVENMLTWKGHAFHSSRLSVSIPGSKLIALYQAP
jgi:hypothetical protein